MYHLSLADRARECLRSAAKHLLDTVTADICARRGGTTIGGQNE